MRESGKVVTSLSGEKVRIPGILKGCKAIGWMVEEWGIAQVSMNITDINATPLHMVYETVCGVAREKGARITGTHVVGLLPKKVLLEAGEHFCRKGNIPVPEDERSLMEVAVREMNLPDKTEFDLSERVIG